MALEDRQDLFGDPTDLLAAEAVWLYREEQYRAPTWDQALDSLTKFPSVSSRDEAEERLSQAICNGEVIARLVERGRGHSFVLEVPDAVAERIARRAIDLRLRRSRKEEQF